MLATTSLANSSSVTADLPIDANLRLVLEKSLSLSRDRLQKFASNAEFRPQLAAAFGEGANLDSLQSDWLAGDFSILVGIEILSSAELGGAKGAYSADTDRIYLSQDFLLANQHNPQALVSVILEEAGHRIDAMFSPTDSPGDEGKIFSRIVQNIPISDAQLQQIKIEDDHSTAILHDGRQIAVEQAGNYLGTNLKDLKSSLDQTLDTLQKAIDGQAFGNSLPILGSTLKGNPAAQFITKLKTEIDNEFAKLPNLNNPTADDIKQVLQAAASKLGILKDVNDLQELESADRVDYVLKVSDQIADSTDLNADLGLPNLGLKVSGKADTKLGYNFTLGFGVDKTKGFFLDTSTAPLDIKLAVTTPGVAAKATLGFLDFDATDSGTSFNGDFSVKLKNANPSNQLFLSDLNTIGTKYQDLLEARLKGNADIELKLIAKTGVKGLPSVSTDLAVNWAFSGGTIADPLNPNSFGDTPTISFNNVTVNAGSVISDFIAPVLEYVKIITDPLQPMIDVVAVNKLPIIDKSLLDIAEAVNPDNDIASAKKFVNQLVDLAALAKTIPKNPGELKIDLGSYTIGGDIRSTKASDSTATAKPALVAAKIQAFGATDAAPSEAQDFLDRLKQKKTEPGGSGLDLAFPLLTDGGKTAVDLLLGKDNVSLFSFTPPLLKFTAKKDLPPIPIFGPVILKFGVEFGVSAGITIGYDNLGFKNFQAPGGTAGDLRDGFYASKPTSSTGVVLGDNLSLFAQLNASAGVSLGVVSLTVGGGIRGTVSFGLIDKVRPDAFIANPLCAFNTTGKLSAIIFGEVSIDFGFFDFTQRLELADITLAEFKADSCDDKSIQHYNVEPEADPVLEAELAGQGIIDRVGTKGNDNIFVTYDSDGAKGENLVVTGLDPDPGKKYTDVKLIVIKGGDGNDLIDLINVKTPGQLSGGAGNDTIIGGLGNDFLMGGAGNNFLNGGEGSNTVDYSADPAGVSVNLATGKATNGYGGTDTLVDIQNAVGSKYNDTLIASDTANAVLQGGAGDDILLGGQKDDVLMGGIGKNDLDGGGGTNTVSYLTAPGPIYVNLSSLNVGDSSPVILPTDASPLYLSANSAVGGYGVVDDTIKNVQNLQGSIYDDILVAGNAAPTGTTYQTKNGFSFTGSYIDGYFGNDLVYAGSGSDVLGGGDGINWLSYALSTNSVTVDLTPIAPLSLGYRLGARNGTGGYATGDTILAAKNQYTDNKGVDTDRSSFQNLEGSNFADTLRGDGGDNIIRGGAGNDNIYGNGGNDTLIGGAGADLLVGGTPTGTLRANLASIEIAANGKKGGGVTASYADSPGGVTVNLATRSGQNSDAQGDTLFGIQNLIGSDRADTLIGGSEFSHDFNPGLSKGGTDVVTGGTGGTNSLTLDYSLGDYGKGIEGGFSFFGNIGSFRRSSSDGKTALDAVDFSKIDRLFLTGTIQDDNITASFNDDVIFASAGNDTVDGRGGNDYLDGGDGIDTLSDYLGDRFTNITLTGIDPNDPNAKQINEPNFSDSSTTIKNFEVFKNITTGYGNDRIVQPGRVNNYFVKAGTGSNYVDPGLGFDTVDGGLGGFFATRTLHVDYSQGDTGTGMTFNLSSADGVPGKSGSGFRRPIGGNDPYAFQDNVDFKNFDRFEVTGTSKSDFITGGDGDDTLNGGAGGNDTLTSGRGNDVLRASSGGSTLQGTNNLDRGFDITTPPPEGSFGFGTTIHTYNLAQDVDTLYGGAGADLFILGDDTSLTNKQTSNALGGIFYTHSFYDGTNTGNDYANIVNFDPSKGDVIQLRNITGYSVNYELSNFGSTAILSLGYTDKNGKKSDFMATITGNFDSLDLKSAAFKYVGDRAPAGPG